MLMSAARVHLGVEVVTFGERWIPARLFVRDSQVPSIGLDRGFDRES
jgi:hypothetical protein